MKDDRMIINIFHDVAKIRGNLKVLKDNLGKVLEMSIERTAKILLRDCRPYIPMLTGALRDSGHVTKLITGLQNYAYQLIWNATNASNNFIYAERQYFGVFQHVDGKYAARWVEKVLQANPDRYIMLVARYFKLGLSRFLNQGRFQQQQQQQQTTTFEGD